MQIMKIFEVKRHLTNEKNFFPIIANILIFFTMMTQAPFTFYGFVQVILLMFIANKIYEIINLYQLNIIDLGKICLFSLVALICISQFLQHIFNFSFLDWLVTFTQFKDQAPMSIFGICAFVALPLGFGIGLNKKLNKRVN